VNSPTWSIVLPTYNRADLLPDAIDSVLAQTVGDWELIIVDDGSEDGTGLLASAHRADSRVRRVDQAHAGRSAARNRGIGLARGKVVCFLDSDDRYLSTTLAEHAEILDSRSDIGMTVGGYEYIDAAGAVAGARRPWLECESLTPAAWLFNCYAMPGSVAVRREWFDAVGAFDPEFELAEDWDLFLRLAFTGCPMAWTRNLVCQRRVHDRNSTNDVRAHLQASLRALDKVFREPGLPPDVAPLEGRARAWAYAASARNAASLGLDGLVGENLRAAAALDALPAWERYGLSLSPLGFPGLVEGPLADVIERDSVADRDLDELLARLPARWGIGAADVRRGLARVELSRFFTAAARKATGEAAEHLGRGLAHDRRWLANRAVLAFLVRRLFRR
jgi:GT2 family glycosyltransferase